MCMYAIEVGLFCYRMSLSLIAYRHMHVYACDRSRSLWYRMSLSLIAYRHMHVYVCDRSRSLWYRMSLSLIAHRHMHVYVCVCHIHLSIQSRICYVCLSHTRICYACLAHTRMCYACLSHTCMCYACLSNTSIHSVAHAFIIADCHDSQQAGRV